MIKHSLKIDAVMTGEIDKPEADLTFKIEIDNKHVKASTFDGVKVALKIGEIFSEVLHDYVVRVKVETVKKGSK